MGLLSTKLIKNEDRANESKSKSAWQGEKNVLNGLARTKYKVVEHLFNKVFKVRTFNELEILSVAFKKHLEDFGLSQGTRMNFNWTRPTQNHQNQNGADETPRVSTSIKTSLGSNEASLLFGFWLPNLTGNADILWSELFCDSNKTVNNKISYKRPLPGYQYDPNLNLTFFYQDQDARDQGFNIYEAGLSLGVDFQIFRNFKHFLGWEAALRNQTGQREMTMATRENCGFSMKSSIKHILLLDDRDSNLFPTKGNLIKLTTEAAGLGGSIAFVKNNLVVQHNYPLPYSGVFQTSFGMGLLNSASCGSKYLDQFMLGGPLSMRGFLSKGVGPKNECITSYWIGNVHLYLPFELKFFSDFKPEAISGYYAHVFLNSGNVSGSNNIRKDLMDLGECCRISCGAGVVISLEALGRIEINYCLPIQKQAGDKTISGFQFGVGFDFM